ncbi:MAG: Gfo/Idh/MocA family oxidoreductase [Pseudomonadota bacterium]
MTNGKIAIIGTGFVADLYMRSLETFPGISLVAAYDRRRERLDAFKAHWNAPTADSLDAILSAEGDARPDIILNLTNPSEHFAVSKQCLEAEFPVYSEKPLATHMGDAKALHALATEQGLALASAPCSLLSQAGQAVVKAVREETMGTPRLVYAELDDDFIPQAPYKSWLSESGAPWPYDDEFQVGCTLEHAGYYLTWLMGAFGPVERVIAASADILPDKEVTGKAAPDFSVGTLFFRDGMIARLTCSIIAPHDHKLRIVGDKGILEVGECWSNTAPVKMRPRIKIRRKLLNSPLAKTIKMPKETHPKVGRWGAAAMNFMLGPAEMLDAIAAGRTPRLGGDFALHLNEVTLALQDAGNDVGVQIMTTTCERPEPMPWALSAQGVAA